MAGRRSNALAAADVRVSISNIIAARAALQENAKTTAAAGCVVATSMTTP